MYLSIHTDDWNKHQKSPESNSEPRNRQSNVPVAQLNVTKPMNSKIALHTTQSLYDVTN